MSENKEQKKFEHRILLVDDEESIIKALRRLLKIVDVEIVSANGGEEALKILTEKPVSLIISDLRMPKMNGVELLHKSMEIQSHTVRIILTGHGDIDATVTAINSGAVKYYLKKPWDDDLLLSRVRESLDLYETQVRNKYLQKLTADQNRELIELNSRLEEKVKEQTRTIREQHGELKKSFMDTIRAFSSILELRLKDVGSHSQRVSQMVRKLAGALDLSEKEQQDVVVAAFLHDIGKLTIPDRILAKPPCERSRSEIDTINAHPVIGQSCISVISGLDGVATIIRHHHENYDGSGFPDGLRDSAIALGARLIRITDEFDHLAFKDGFPKASHLREATAHLILKSGSFFDPELVRKFVELNIAESFTVADSSVPRELRPIDLEQGMVVAADVFTRNGLFVLPRGARLSRGMIQRLINIDRFDTIIGGVQVYDKPPGEKKEQAAVLDSSR